MRKALYPTKAEQTQSTGGIVTVPEEIQPRGLRPNDAARFVGVSRRTMMQYIYDGKIPHTKLGERSYILDRLDLEKLIEDGKRVGTK